MWLKPGRTQVKLANSFKDTAAEMLAVALKQAVPFDPHVPRGWVRQLLAQLSATPSASQLRGFTELHTICELRCETGTALRVEQICKGATHVQDVP